MPEETQRQYELTFILSPDLGEEEISSFEHEIEKNIENLEGTLKKKGKLEKRSLSYPIKKFQSGYYLVVNFLFSPEKLEELYSALKHKKEILRYIITVVEKPSLAKTIEDKKPKPVARGSDLSGKIPKVEKIKKLTEEKPSPKKASKSKTKLEEIDKKLEEILGI